MLASNVSAGMHVRDVIDGTEFIVRDVERVKGQYKITTEDGDEYIYDIDDHLERLSV